MDFKTIEKLAQLMEDKGLTGVEYCQGDTKIHLKKEVAAAAVAPAPVLAQPQPVAVIAEAAPAPVAPAAPATLQGELLDSPLVGVGYLAGAPGEQPFAPVGSKVKKGQVLCIIEAMKVMNEFKAPRDGEIVEVCFEDGQMVEYGQGLFRLA